jgi:dTDP-4-amino-4,6-dideoxygalactose transaminase
MRIVSNKPLVVEGGKRSIKTDLKQFKPIPETGIQRAVEIMESGELFRYGVTTPEKSETSLFEKEFADYLGMKYALGVNSCGSAMFIALKCIGVQPGDKVLMNAFTFTAVPSAIHHASAIPVLVESSRDFTVNIPDLRRKAAESGSKVLLLSYMRGHVPNMDEVMRICEEFNLILIEDCAHACSTSWKNVQMGHFGRIACFSTQSSKALSAGEGGMLATNDDEVFSKAMLYAGTYEGRWSCHFNPPSHIQEIHEHLPCYSLRMNEMTAAILRPQIPRLPEIAVVHKQNYKLLAKILSTSDHIEIPSHGANVKLFCDTLQFHLLGLSREEILRFIDVAKMEGIPIQVFGLNGNVRDFRSWGYLEDEMELPLTESWITSACDLPLGSHLTQDDITVIGDVILRLIDYIIVHERTDKGVLAE